MIEWNDSFSIGIEHLDKQHKNLFQYCNDLGEGISQGVTSKQALDGALKFLGGYIKGHMGQEETCMHKYACPIAGKNKLAHQEFIKVYVMLQKKISEGGNSEDLLKELHFFLETWLVDHICKIDIQLRSCVP